MLTEKAKRGLENASPEKRYKSFLNMVVDSEEVWLLNSEDGYAVYEIDGTEHLMIWPHKEFCMDFMENGEQPEAIEIHEFLDNCYGEDSPTHFMVFPTRADCYVVTTEKLCEDIEEYLDEVE